MRVERRRGQELYINDGAYGALFDAAHIGWRFPVALLREDESEEELEGFSFYGPTCDDMDHMVGPFMLPADVKVGDYIEIGMLGAYGAAMRTGFNCHQARLRRAPLPFRRGCPSNGPHRPRIERKTISLAAAPSQRGIFFGAFYPSTTV